MLDDPRHPPFNPYGSYPLQVSPTDALTCGQSLLQYPSTFLCPLISSSKSFSYFRTSLHQLQRLSLALSSILLLVTENCILPRSIVVFFSFVYPSYPPLSEFIFLPFFPFSFFFLLFSLGVCSLCTEVLVESNLHGWPTLSSFFP